MISSNGKTLIQESLVEVDLQSPWIKQLQELLV
jgi:hypothetical protein